MRAKKLYENNSNYYKYSEWLHVSDWGDDFEEFAEAIQYLEDGTNDDLMHQIIDEFNEAGNDGILDFENIEIHRIVDDDTNELIMAHVEIPVITDLLQAMKKKKGGKRMLSK